MPYLPNTIQDQQAMLEAIGVESIDAIFDMIPEVDRLQRPLDLPGAQGELELTSSMARLGGKNRSIADTACFLGAGAYDHFIPAVVDMVASRSEFYTAYTPYQAEASQGTLQAIFEYQTLVTQLTGMDISNASLYDAATALVEAILMALAAGRGRRRIVLPGSLHPEYRETVSTYLDHLDVELVEVPTPDGTLDIGAIGNLLNDDTACLVVQQPNFFGALEEVDQLAEMAHAVGALVIGSVGPISLGLLRRPSEWGADIVVAEGQPLGCPLAYGGPYLGILACSEKFARKMPGRLVGQTVDRRGRRCWVLTLQTREQHIRREKATSNICTNQGLYALRAAVYLATVGPNGLNETAQLCTKKAHYAAEQIIGSSAACLAFERPFFNEFVLKLDSPEQVEQVIEKGLEADILVGAALGRWYESLSDCLLIAVTERRTREEIDRMAALFS
jgi:glycine cleavage system P protein (glycine dehydrogenase) subunit 1